MPQSEAADFFDQHLSKMLVAPSFEQAPPTLPPGAGWRPDGQHCTSTLQAGESEASTQSSEHRQWQAPPTDYGDNHMHSQVSRDPTASSSGKEPGHNPFSSHKAQHNSANGGGYGMASNSTQHQNLPAPPPAAPQSPFDPPARLPAPPPAPTQGNLQRATKQASSMAIDPMSSQALLPDRRYRVKDEIEVWSNSHSRWCPGTVEAVDGVKISVKYSSPEGAAMTKQMPESHEHLRHAVGGTPTCASMLAIPASDSVSSAGGYKVGDPIQIWSKSQYAWCNGFVEKVQGDLVGIKYSSTDGQSMTKMMPMAHEHLRLNGKASPPPPPGGEHYRQEEENVDDYMSYNMSSQAGVGSAMGSTQAPHLRGKGYRPANSKSAQGEEFVTENTSWGTNGGMGLCGMPIKAKKVTPLNPDGTPVARCPDLDRCCRCSMPVGSYFDHACPRCEGIVCLACLDDVKYIVGSYRCPHCGDQAHNEASLKSTIWYLNVYRNAQRAVGAVPILVAGLFGFGPEGNAKRTSRMACVEEEGEEVEQTTPLPTPKKRETAGSKGPPPPPPPRPKASAPREASSDEPEYHTRPPAGWEEGGGAWLGKGRASGTSTSKGQATRPPPPPAPARQQQDGRRPSKQMEAGAGNGAFQTRVPPDMKSPMR